MENRWFSFVSDIQKSNSRNDKIAIVPKYHDLTPLWNKIYTGTTGVTEKSIRKYYNSCKDRRKNIKRMKREFDILSTLDKLCKRDLSGHAAQDEIVSWLEEYPNHIDDLIILFEGKPRLGIGVVQINKALVSAGFPPVCSIFEVCLAESFKESRFTSPKDDWYIMQKYDGVRGVLFMGSKTRPPGIYTRMGNMLKSLTDFVSTLPTDDSMNYVLDGELCIIDDKGEEDFTAAVSKFRKDKEQVTKFKFKVFDCLRESEFNSGFSSIEWSRRILHSREIVEKIGDSRIEVVPYELYTTESIVKWQEYQNKNNWEGLMVRMDTSYVNGRTWNLMKIKKFQTAEYVVVDISTGTKGILDPTTGTKVDRRVMSSVSILHKGNYVSVGSGFTDEQRLEYLQYPERIVGKTIEVQYFQESVTKDKNKKDIYSLRFPTVKMIWGSKRDM